MARSPDDDDFSSSPNRRSESTLEYPPVRPSAKRGLRALFSVERVVSSLKTAAWLVPLTLLIWVYAEQQQEYRQTINGVSVALQSTVSNRSTEFADGVQQVTVNLTLRGARDAVEKVGKQLLGPPGLALDVGSRGTGTLDVDVVSAAQNLPLFRQAGVTVTEAQPPSIRVNVDNVLERDATVMVSPHANQFSGSVTFDPPKVRLRGPKSQMDAVATQLNGSLVVYADLSKVDLQLPGDHPPEAVPLLVPSGVTAQPAQASAKVRVTTAYSNATIDRVPILVTAPPNVWHDYYVQLGESDDPSTPPVHVTGPADKVALVTSQNGQPPRVQVWAELTVRLEDAGQDRQGTLVITNLPEGVKPAPEDAARKQSFKLIPRGG